MNKLIVLALLTAATGANAADRGAIDRGRANFKDFGCVKCHGAVGQGSASGLKLAPEVLPADAIITFLRGTTGPMPRYGAEIMTDAQIKAARGRRAEALANWKEAVLEALAESEDAMTSLVKREDQLRALDVALDAGRRTQGSVDQAYRAGAASRIDALLAEAQALSAEGAAIDARQETSRAAVASFRALGGGWSAPTAH